MGQSIGSVGNSHKQGGAGNQKKNQPSTNPARKWPTNRRRQTKASRTAAPITGRARPANGKFRSVPYQDENGRRAACCNAGPAPC